MALANFHPTIQQWFASRFEAPTEPQHQGWPSIAAGQHTLIAAPTGSGKTLTAFLACIDRLWKEGQHAELPNEMRVVYVSPLRALSNDMHRNLTSPLLELTTLAESRNEKSVNIRVGLRTGDSTPSERAALVRKPPQIVVTTPESLYLLLTSAKGRVALSSVETLIVDEIHALVRDKRGSHLGLTMERLDALVGKPVQRIGLSATQKPIERTARFLVGFADAPVEDDSSPPVEIVQSSLPFPEADTLSTPQTEVTAADLGGSPHACLTEPAENIPCEIIDVGHQRELDLNIEIPPSELSAVCTHEQWAEVNARLVELIQQHRSTLIFVNTRRLAERVTHQLTELLGEGVISSHHGSLAADMRLKTERQLKSGELRAVVATASLELGLDIGYIDLVIQIGSPRSIATFLQRIGRSGHSLGLIPKGRLVALTRDELLESMALIRAVKHRKLDAVKIPSAPLDVLAQQIVAEVSAQEWDVDELFHVFRRSDSFRHLARHDYDRTVEYLSEGISRVAGRSRVYLHYDQVQRKLRTRRGSSIAATSNAGAIPEIASYRVVAEPEQTPVGTLDEDFAIESQGGDIFLLGNTSWRILNVRGGDVNVADAHGAPPTIPFWRGEAPGRTWELSEEVSDLRSELENRVANLPEAQNWLRDETGCSEFAAEQITQYALAQKAAVGLLPTCKRVVFERFFDESGGMQLVVHAPFGGAVNRAWGLAMRKRFCRSFDFELQATADDEGFILSLGPQHSFPIESLFPMLTRANAKGLLEQAVLTTPMFQVRWRWNVTRALLVLRRKNGKKVPPALQRFRADDLLTAVFPKLTGCQEEHTGDHELPDHPLTQQTMEDCLTEAVDIDGLHRVLDRIQAGEITLVARDTREPSPFAYELLNANAYAFLDGGEIQERRARAVATRRSISVESTSDLGWLDPAAIAQVQAEAQPPVRSADELHDLLLGRFILLHDEAVEWRTWVEELLKQKRVTSVALPTGERFWVPAERLPAVLTVYPDGKPEPEIEVPPGIRRDWEASEARVEVMRGLVELSGPITAEHAASVTAISVSQAFAALEGLEGEGIVLRGRFTPKKSTGTNQQEQSESGEVDPKTSDTKFVEWCHRGLLARIHRLTIHGLRKQIEPVEVDAYFRFLAQHQGLESDTKRSGANALFEVIQQLQGLDIAASTWENDILPARLQDYDPRWLDELCLAGEVSWGRLFPPKPNPSKARPMGSLTRNVPISMWLRSDVSWLISGIVAQDAGELSGNACEIREILEQRGAMFINDLREAADMLPSHLEEAIGELVSRGLLTADGFSGLRNLTGSTGKETRRRVRTGRKRFRPRTAMSGTGRWSLWRPLIPDAAHEDRAAIIEQWAWQLLHRWGVVFRDLLIREPGAPRWYELAQMYRRLEARGEIRGGRFIAGVSGEQFATGDTVRQLRKVRDESAEKQTGTLTVVAATDPLNLVGVITEHPRVPRIAGNRVAFIDGRPVAAWQGGDLRHLGDVPEEMVTRMLAKLGVPPGQFSAVLPAIESNATDEESESANDASDVPSGKQRKPSPPHRIPRPLIS